MQMKGSELRVKRVSAGISGAILCLKAGLGRTRLSGIERGTISMGPAEAARIEAALDELTHAKRKADEVAMSLGWPTRSDQAESGAQGGASLLIRSEDIE
jgi:transcriptional regulator with XRE-family HTH domain